MVLGFKPLGLSKDIPPPGPIDWPPPGPIDIPPPGPIDSHPPWAYRITYAITPGLRNNRTVNKYAK